MEKPFHSSITHPLFGLSFAKIHKANNPLFPRRLLELLLSIKDFSILCASTIVILYLYFNIFGDFSKKTPDYLLTIIAPKSDSFPQSRLLQLGQTNIVISNSSKYSVGIIKSVSQVLQWFIVIIVTLPPIHNIGQFQYKYFPMKEFTIFGVFQNKKTPVFFKRHQQNLEVYYLKISSFYLLKNSSFFYRLF